MFSLIPDDIPNFNEYIKIDVPFRGYNIDDDDLYEIIICEKIHENDRKVIYKSTFDDGELDENFIHFSIIIDKKYYNNYNYYYNRIKKQKKIHKLYKAFKKNFLDKSELPELLKEKYFYMSDFKNPQHIVYFIIRPFLFTFKDYIIIRYEKKNTIKLILLLFMHYCLKYHNLIIGNFQGTKYFLTVPKIINNDPLEEEKKELKNFIIESIYI